MVLRSVITIFATIFISQIAVAPALAERKVAFVVGIDKYDNLGQQQQLQRAVNDARSVGGGPSIASCVPLVRLTRVR